MVHLPPLLGLELLRRAQLLLALPRLAQILLVLPRLAQQLVALLLPRRGEMLPVQARRQALGQELNRDLLRWGEEGIGGWGW